MTPTNSSTIKDQNKIYLYVLSTIVFTIPTVLLAGYIGVIIELLVGLIGFQLISKRINIAFYRRLLLFIGILFLGWVVIGLGILLSGYLVQISTMGS